MYVARESHIEGKPLPVVLEGKPLLMVQANNIQVIKHN